MAGMHPGRRSASVFICANYIVTAMLLSLPSTLAQTSAASDPVDFSTTVIRNTTSVYATIASNVSTSANEVALVASTTIVSSFGETTMTTAASSLDVTTAIATVAVANATTPHATEIITSMTSLLTSSSGSTSYANASTVVSISSSQGPTSAFSSLAYDTTTTAALESTAALTTAQQPPPSTTAGTTTAGTTTASTFNSGTTLLPLTEVMIITVSAAGGLLVIIIIIGFAVHCRRRRRENSQPDFPITDRVKPAPRSRTVNLADFEEYIAHQSADSDYGFAEEFEELDDVGADQAVTAAREERNRAKNRYSNVQPYDHSRVKLHTSIDSEKSDYINANYMPGHSGPKEFIATQGPMLGTADDFWQMVWEQQCKAIVMLTRCTEGMVDKCYPYWPSGHDPVVYGDVTVQVTDELEQPEWKVTNFGVSIKANVRLDDVASPQAAVRHVRHFHYTAFPDHRAPDVESMLQFVRTVRSKLQPSPGGPVIVHCSAGVGRTGTFIAIDRLLQQIDEGRTSVDIFHLVHQMRMQRMYMVQTEEQYISIYKAVLHELRKRRSSASPNGGADNHAFADDR